MLAKLQTHLMEREKYPPIPTAHCSLTPPSHLYSACPVPPSKQAQIPEQVTSSFHVRKFNHLCPAGLIASLQKLVRGILAFSKIRRYCFTAFSALNGVGFGNDCTLLYPLILRPSIWTPCSQVFCPTFHSSRRGRRWLFSICKMTSFLPTASCRSAMLQASSSQSKHWQRLLEVPEMWFGLERNFNSHGLRETRIQTA